VTSQANTEGSAFSPGFTQICSFAAITAIEHSGKTLQAVILQCVAKNTDRRLQNANDLAGEIERRYSLRIPRHEVEQALYLLVRAEQVHEDTAGRLTLQREERERICQLLEQIESRQNRVQTEWVAEVKQLFPALDSESAWSALQSYLAAAFRQHGMHTVALLDPDVEIGEAYYDSLSALRDRVVAANFREDDRADANQAIHLFLAQVHESRDRAEFVVDLADGAFAIFSLGVAPEIADKLRENLSKLTIFLDTNFLMGVLGLTRGPQAEVSRDLVEAVRKDSLPFKLVYHPETERELQRVLHWHEQQLRPHKWARSLSRAVVQSGTVSGLLLRYHERNAEEGLDVDAFFAPFRHLGLLLEQYGITPFLPMGESFSASSDLVAEYGDYLLTRGRDKVRPTLEHDMDVLRTVRALRTTARSTLDAGALLLTYDNLLYRFDRETAATEGYRPCSVLPNPFWQVLRPFVSHDHDFDLAFASTFAIPEIRSVSRKSEEAAVKTAGILAGYKDVPEQTAVKMLTNNILLDQIAAETDEAKYHEYIDATLVAENQELLAEKRSFHEQLEVERVVRSRDHFEMLEREEGHRVAWEAEKGALMERLREETRFRSEAEQTTSALTGRLSALEEREKSSQVRTRRFFRASLIAVAALVAIVSLEWTVNNVQAGPFLWIYRRPNSFGIQGGVDLIILLAAIGFVWSEHRKLLWIGAVLPLIVCIISILGGR
jgi:hypothetical protein